jgi:hypothetical protein
MMQTFEEQRAFFQDEWPALREAVERGGAAAVIEHIAAHDDARERRVLFAFVRQGLVMDDWQGKSLDPYIEVARAGMQELLRQADSASDLAARDARTDGANVIAYNLAADLADCWPGDATPRTRAHFEAGLAAAEQCVRWRETLGKGPGPRSMAFWVKGMHELSLGEVAAATASWQRSLDEAVAAARAQGGGDAVDAHGDFAVVLGAGYLGLARWIAGEADGRGSYEAALDAFRAQLAHADRKDDAQFGIDQLETVRQRYGPATA